MRFVLRRAGFFLLTLWAAVTLNFFLPRMMPGNPAIAMMGKFRGKVSGQELQTLETIFGAGSGQSLPAQYVHYLGDVFTGNFGTSLFFFPTPVGTVVGGAICWTLGLVGVTTILAFVARHRDRHPRRLAARRAARQHRAAAARHHLRDPVLLGRDDVHPDLRAQAAVAALVGRLRTSPTRPAWTALLHRRRLRARGAARASPCSSPRSAPGR